MSYKSKFLAQILQFNITGEVKEMKINDIFSVKFLIGFVVAVGILVYFGGIRISNNIEARVEKGKELLKEIQKADKPDLKKMQELIEIVSVTAVRA